MQVALDMLISYLRILQHMCTLAIGLPHNERMKLENIHFLCCSNKVGPLELVEPLVDDLQKLEEGILMFDASVNESVLVIAPVMLLIADNPMSSDLCNHQGSTARRFCRMCKVCVMLQMSIASANRAL